MMFDFLMKVPILRNRYYKINVRIHKPRMGEIDLNEDIYVHQLQISWDKGRIKESGKEKLYEIELLKNKATFPLPSNNFFYIDEKGRQYLNVFCPRYGIFIPLQPFKAHIEKNELGELRTIMKMEGYKAYSIAKMKQNFAMIKKPSAFEKYLPLISATLLIIIFVIGMIFQGKQALDIYNSMQSVIAKIGEIANAMNLNQTLRQVPNLTIVPGG